MTPIPETSFGQPIPAAIDPALVDQRIDTLEDLHDDNAAKIKATDAKLSNWSSILDTPTGKLVVTTAGTTFVALCGLLVAWTTGKLTPPVVPPIAACLNPTGCKCGCVTTGKCVCKDCDHPMLTTPAPDPVVPPATKSKAARVVFYLTAASDVPNDSALVKLLDAGRIVRETKMYPIGMGYQFKGETLSMPVMALKDALGADLDVVALGTAQEAVAWLGKNQ